MAYTKINFVNDETDASAENFNHMESGIANSYNVSLLAVSETAPSECSTGDKYYNTSTKKIYTATSEDTWGTTGEDPISDILYIVLEERTSYTWDGTDLVSVGGGSGGETLPVGTEVDFIGSSSDIPVGWEQVDSPTNIMTATFTTNYTLSSSNPEKIILSSNNSIGTKLTISNDGGIKMGSGVNKVKVCANINFQSVTAGQKELDIYLNDTINMVNVSVISGRTTLTIAHYLMSVQENDVIYLYATGTSGDVLRRNVGFSNITVEVVE